MLIPTVPVRRVLKRRGISSARRARGGRCRLGVLVGGTTGAGVILLSLLMATGLAGAAVIATDASISIVMGDSRFRCSALPA